MKKRILDLRPTQFSLGLKEVEDKVVIIKTKPHLELNTYLNNHLIPVVVGPGNDLFMIDHHHLVRALWESGHTHVFVDIKADFSKMSVTKFWARMKKLKWAFLFDQLGNGPHNPEYLPDSIRGLGDNKYRSLAWIVREQGGYDKSPKPFTEFYWAEMFRKHMKGMDPFSQKGMKSAMKLCQSKYAKKLPGYKK